MSTFPTGRRVNSMPVHHVNNKRNTLNQNSLNEKQQRMLRKARFSAPKPEVGSFDYSSEKISIAEMKSYGFVSRGEDSRLQESEQAQRNFFDWILSTFKDAEKEKSSSPVIASEEESLNEKQSIHSSSVSGPGSAQMLSSLRKLREALLHQKPSEFSKRVHLFSVRVSAAVGHYQTYIPSIKYLLSDANMLLTVEERSEIAAILVLHISHRNNEHAEAVSLFFKYLHPQEDARILNTLIAFSEGDYDTWINLYNNETDHALFAVMKMGLRQILEHMIACFDVAYFTYSLGDFKNCLPKGMSWMEFMKDYGVKWEVECDTVHIRRRLQRVNTVKKDVKAHEKSNASRVDNAITNVEIASNEKDVTEGQISKDVSESMNSKDTVSSMKLSVKSGIEASPEKVIQVKPPGVSEKNNKKEHAKEDEKETKEEAESEEKGDEKEDEIEEMKEEMKEKTYDIKNEKEKENKSDTEKEKEKESVHKIDDVKDDEVEEEKESNKEVKIKSQSSDSNQETNGGP